MVEDLMTEKIRECEIEQIELVEPGSDWIEFLDTHDVPYEVVDPDEVTPDTEVPRIDIHYESQGGADTYMNGSARTADYIAKVLARKYHGEIRSTT